MGHNPTFRMVENPGVFAFFIEAPRGLRSLQDSGGAAGEQRRMGDCRGKLAYGRDPASVPVS